MYNIYLVSVTNTIKPLKKIEKGSLFTQYRFRFIENNNTYTFVPLTLISNNKVEEAFNKLIKLFKSENGSTLKEDLENGVVEALNFADEIKFELIKDLDDSKVENTLKLAKTQILRKIDEYDNSINVNSFYLNGQQVWLDKSTRVGLINSLNIEKVSGKQVSVLWFKNSKFDINIEYAIQMLNSLELYALECYNVTASHKAVIEKMEQIDDVKKYDYTKGYPKKLTFNV